MTSPLPEEEKRKPLSKLEFARLAVEQNGKCAQCGKPLKFEPRMIRDEHVVSLYGGGGNELENRQLWCLPCTKPKDKADKARHAKIDRIRKQSGGCHNCEHWSRGFDTMKRPSGAKHGVCLVDGDPPDAEEAVVTRFDDWCEQQEAKPKRSTIQSRGFQKPGPDYKHKWPKRGFGK